MKSIVITLILLFSGIHFAEAQSIDRYWWDSDGVKAQWYSQDDVFAFKTFNNVGVSYPASMPGVISTDQEKEWQELHIVRFQPGLPQSIMDGTINNLMNNPDFECAYDVVTPYPNLDQADNKWRITDHYVMVTFRDPGITTAEVDSFMVRWNLTLHAAPPPGLSPQATWPWVFENVHTERCGARKAIDIARDIMMVDSAMVQYAEPNILNLLVPHSNDPEFGKMWHVQNTGQTIIPGQAGLPDADCDIVEAWNKGFTGAGINIAVIDYQGFDTLHEDLRDTYVNGYNSVDSTISVFDIDLTYYGYSHGQSVAGVIAANKDNQKGAAGVVPDAKIGAFLTTGNPVQVIDCFAKIFVESRYPYSIVNMSFGGYDTTLNGYNGYGTAANILANEGRSNLGIVLIASAGNHSYYVIPAPARFPDVIAMGATTPADSAKVKFDRWDTIPVGFNGPWGTNHGTGVDFAAPGFAIPTTDLRDTFGLSLDDYHLFGGTSAAAPIASGIAAMILQANPNLPYQGPGSVFAFLKMGAERVGGYNYNAYWPNPQDTGRSEEIGYGRLNACNSLNLVAMEEEKEAFRANFRVANLLSGEVRAYYDISHLGGEFDLEIINLNGQVIRQFQVPREQFWLRIPTVDLPKGMYLTRLNGKQKGFSATKKMIIFK